MNIEVVFIKTQNIDLWSNKYYNLSNDYIFKEAVNHPEILKYLLSVCFSIEIQNYQKRNVELNKNNKKRYAPIVDFKIETSDTIYLIEMQNKNLYNMEERCLFSFSRQCQNIMKPRDNFKKIKKIHILIFLNYAFKKDNHYQILGKNLQTLFTNKLEIYIFNIPKELQSPSKKRKNIAEFFTLTSIQNINRKTLNKTEKLILDYIKNFNLPNEQLLEIERRNADMYLEEIGLINAREAGLEEGLAKGMKKGLEQGIEQGIEKGIEQGIERGIEQGIERGIEQGIEQGIKQGIKIHQEQMLIRLLKQGNTLKTISKLLEIPIHQLKEIIKNLNIENIQIERK